jgi:hypothetical protein
VIYRETYPNLKWNCGQPLSQDATTTPGRRQVLAAAPADNPCKYTVQHLPLKESDGYGYAITTTHQPSHANASLSDSHTSRTRILYSHQRSTEFTSAFSRNGTIMTSRPILGGSQPQRSLSANIIQKPPPNRTLSQQFPPSPARRNNEGFVDLTFDGSEAALGRYGTIPRNGGSRLKLEISKDSKNPPLVGRNFTSTFRVSATSAPVSRKKEETMK